MTVEELVRRVVRHSPKPGPLLRRPSDAIDLESNLMSGDWHWRSYPDPFQRDLVEQIIAVWNQIERAKGSKINISERNVILTHGGVDALQLVLSTFCDPGIDSIALTPPTFEAFYHWAKLQDLEVREFTECDLHNVSRSAVKAILLCSPNNPTGSILDVTEVEALHDRFDGIIIVDEAYADFSDNASSMSLVNRLDRVLILRTLSKSFGMAGLRTGAIIGHPSAIEEVRKVQVPYCVSSPVRDCLRERLRNPNEIFGRIETVKCERARLRRLALSSPLVKSIPASHANFLHIGWNKPKLALAHLQEHNISVRNFEGFSRVTIGSIEENNAFLDAIGATREL